MQALVSKLNEYIHAYYVLDNPLVSDSQFDLLYSKLQQLEMDTGIVLENSPTRRVGTSIDTKFAPHTHLSRLYSLDKVNSYQELIDWANKTQKKLDSPIRYVCEYKIDGLTLSLTYENTRLVKAATRGNGIVGETITPQVVAMSSIPKTINFDGILEIQGEGYIKLSDLEQYNLDNPTNQLKNARNGVAGAIRNLDTQVVVDRKVTAAFYHINYIRDNQLQNSISNHIQALQFLKDNGLPQLKNRAFDDINQVVEYIKSIDRDKLDFLIDGMVIKVDDLTQRQELGFTDKFPRWAVAYKFEAIEFSTTVLDISWQVGRTGKLTPLAHLQPVEIGGATVSRATLNNIDDIIRKGVGVGSVVFVRRSNDVIPEILYSVSNTSTKQVDLPDICPVCDSQLVRDGVHIFCKNQRCPKIVCGKIEHWVSKNCMDIEGISQKTIEYLFRLGLLDSVVDLYRLTPQNLQGLDGFGDKKIENLIGNINKSKNPPLSNFLNALGINGVGKKTASDLAQFFQTLDNLSKATLQQLIEIPEVGENIANNILQYFVNPININLLNQLKSLGVQPQQSKVVAGKLNNKKIVITGTLSKPRSYFVKLIKDNGGIVADAISKTVDIVLAGEQAGTKLDKANSLGLNIINESDFVKILGVDD